MHAARPIIERSLGVLFLALVGAAAVFFIIRAAPGDPALTVLGDQATPEAIAAFHKRWHLDEPLSVQFWIWLTNALRGDLGTSLTITNGTPIRDLLASRIPQTAFIGTYAIVIAISISLIMGTIAAMRHGRASDTVATSLAAIGISMPDFWIAYVLIYSLALGLHWFPSYGYVSPGVSLPGALHSGFLPALAIAAPMAASFTRILRTSLLDNLYRDHVRVARSLGHSSRFIFIHHIFRNALIPYVTVIGLQIRYLLGGTVIIERIFGIPGVGNLMVDAAFGRDFPIVQACALLFLFLVLVVNFAIDMVCMGLNPKMR
ncbi:MAG: ABC transporter permease [Hyphomicrobiales bacterium]